MSSRDLLAPYLPESRWTYGDVVLALVAGVVGAVVVGGLIGAGSIDEIGVSELSATLVAQASATFLAVMVIGRRRGTGTWWRDVGFRMRPAYVWGLAAGIGLQVVAALVIGPLMELIAPDAPRQEIVDVAERATGTESRILFAVMVVVVAPLVEETVFRGMLLSRLRRSMGPLAAISVSAAAFAALHLLDPNALIAVPGLFLIGLGLGWFALRTGDIGFALFAHAGVNLTGVIVLMFAEDILDAVEAVLVLVG